MGSYLSIVNDTLDTFQCNIGPDQAAIAIFGIVAAVVGAVAAIVATGGAALGGAAPAIAFTAAAATAGTSTITVASVTAAAAIITAVGTTAGTAATAAGLLQVIVDQSTKELQNSGYQTIPPGGSYKWGKMSLSLWQQGHCVRHRTVPAEMTFITDEVYLRPIFSGATDNSNIDHNIQFWIDKFGFENEQRFVMPPPDDLNGSWGDPFAPLPTGGVTTPTAAPQPGTTTTLAPQPGGVQPVTPTTAPMETVLICDPCGNGQPVVNLLTRIFLPTIGFLTCGTVADAARNGNIDAGTCPLLAQYLTACGCPAPINPDEASPLPVPVDVREVINSQTNALGDKIDSQTDELDMMVASMRDALVDTINSQFGALGAKVDAQTDELDAILAIVDRKLQAFAEIIFAKLEDLQKDFIRHDSSKKKTKDDGKMKGPKGLIV
ncbi:hypothetical protein ACA910_013844 [Epithemia clementina (nom. ined.)]